ncbi:MAG: phenylalanine--tRNA ligase subunit beta [bacterium]
MKVSCNWLKEFVDFKIAPEELADKLTMAGLEVTGIICPGEEIDKVVVAQVLGIEPHPAADKLTVCQVFDGENTLQIVCGAKNIKAGDKVPLALDGSSLPGGVKINKSVIRGIESYGMLCSEKELGLSEEASGILLLDPDSLCGEDIKKTLGQDDIILEVELTPNRGDCLSILGVAREIAAILKLPLRLPSVKLAESSEDIKKLIKVSIKDPKLCPRYAARMVKNVKIGPSPLALQYRLRAMGVRPINNVVDITNLVLIELGHPLHAFDYDLIEGKEIVVRPAGKNEKIITLDEVERKLDEEVLVIADAKKPVALAGVMGGLASSVSAKTVNVLLESAYFNPVSIRRSSRKLELGTEASYHFERGVDIDNLIVALEKTAWLIQQYCGGEIARGLIDSYPKKIAAKKIVFRPRRTNKILGIEIPQSQMTDILKRLGFTVGKQASGTKASKGKNKGDKLEVLIPPYRNDIFGEIDLVEEVARIYGYDKIEVAKPYWQPVDNAISKNLLLEKILKDSLVKSGFYEVVNFSFMNEEWLDKLHLPADDKRREVLKIQNPLSVEMATLRSTLIPAILENVSWNLRHKVQDIKIFELAAVFIPRDKGSLPLEKKMLLGAVCGWDSEPYWGKGNKPADFYYLSGVMETLLETVGLEAYYRNQALQVDRVYHLTRSGNKLYHPGHSADITVEGKILGGFGELSPILVSELGFGTPVYMFELDADELLSYLNLDKKYRPLSKYPAMTRDIALIVPNEVSAADILSLIRQEGQGVLKEVKLFDMYTGEQIKKGYRSLAYSLIYQSDEATLTDEEVNKVHAKIVKELQSRLKAEIRV